MLFCFPVKLAINVFATINIVLKSKIRVKVGTRKSTADYRVPSVAIVCNICQERPFEPSITLCGHVYCWSCIKKWYDLREKPDFCPVCRRPNNVFDIIPIHARGTVPHYRNKRVLMYEEYKAMLDGYDEVLVKLMNVSSRGTRGSFNMQRFLQMQIRLCSYFLCGLFLCYFVSRLK